MFSLVAGCPIRTLQARNVASGGDTYSQGVYKVSPQPEPLKSVTLQILLQEPRLRIVAFTFRLPTHYLIMFAKSIVLFVTLLTFATAAYVLRTPKFPVCLIDILTHSFVIALPTEAPASGSPHRDPLPKYRLYVDANGGVDEERDLHAVQTDPDTPTPVERELADFLHAGCMKRSPRGSDLGPTPGFIWHIPH